MEEGRENPELRLQTGPQSISAQGGDRNYSCEMTPADQIFETLLQRAAETLNARQAHSPR